MELPPDAIRVMPAERRRHPRFQLLTCVDVSASFGGDVYWGGLIDVSRTGVALTLSHPVKPGEKLTLRFRFRIEDGGETSEALLARVVWQSGDKTGLEFERPLTAGSPAVQQAPHLAAQLAMKEAGP